MQRKMKKHMNIQRKMGKKTTNIQRKMKKIYNYTEEDGKKIQMQQIYRER